MTKIIDYVRMGNDSWGGHKLRTVESNSGPWCFSGYGGDPKDGSDGDDGA